MVAFTSNDSQVHPALVYLEDFSMLYPGQILSAMRLKICPQKLSSRDKPSALAKSWVMTENLSK